MSVPDAPSSRPVERICFVVSSPMTALAFLTVHVRSLSERYEVELALNADPGALEHPLLRRATLRRARIVRAISPLADLRGLLDLIGILRRGRFSAVHSITPKAGLLSAIAGFIARVPVRVHTYTGQVWATRTGPSRWLLKQMDRIIARLDTHLLADSVSQRDFLRASGVLAPGEGEVIGAGSVAGVDRERFKPDPAARAAVRAELRIPASSLVFLFVGRLNRDKGVTELAAAFDATARVRSDVFLIVVGPDEDGLVSELMRRSPSSAGRMRFVGWTSHPERYMAASDIFCLPSHREGFGSVVIEAAAVGLPAIGSRIYGLVDAIEDGRTGLLVSAGDVSGLTDAMLDLARNDALRGSLAEAARNRALRDFSDEALAAGLRGFYASVFSKTTAESRRLRVRL